MHVRSIQQFFQTRWFMWAVGLIVVALTMRSVLGPFFFRPHDFTHAARLVEMQRSLQAGEFPVRWSRNFGFGYGMPLFNFYAPLPYYLGQVPLFLGSSPVDSIKFLYALNGVLAFAGMFLLARALWGEMGGLVGAVAFSFSSYRAVDLFVRGALGEAFAMVLLPFLLYGILRVVRKKKDGIIVAALSLAAILLCHNLTGMISVVLVICFGVLATLVSAKKELGATLAGIFCVITIGVGLSAFYTLPAFFEKNFTRVDQTITTGYFDYHNHFLCTYQLFVGKWGYGGSVPGCNDGISFSFGTVPWVVFALSVAILFLRGGETQRKMGVVFSFLFVLATFMTIGKSSAIWDHLPILRYFQFPWRFLAFSHVFFALLIGGVGIIATKRTWVPFVLLALVLGVVAMPFYQPEKQLQGGQLSSYYTTTPEFIRTDISKTLNDYLPREISDAHLPTPVSERVMLSGKGSVSVERDAPASINITVHCEEDCKLSVNLFQFPGWKATVDGRQTELATPKDGLPIYFLSLPRGTHAIRIYLSDTPVREVGNVVSLLCVLIFGVFMYAYVKTGEKFAL